MMYVIMGAAVVSVASIRTVSYAVKEFKKRNYLGGIMAFSLALSSVFLSFSQIKMH